MKRKQIELDVDFIGEQGSLTQKEEKAISEYFKTRKMLQAKKTFCKTKVHLRPFERKVQGL